MNKERKQERKKERQEGNKEGITTYIKKNTAWYEHSVCTVSFRRKACDLNKKKKGSMVRVHRLLQEERPATCRPAAAAGAGAAVTLKKKRRIAPVALRLRLALEQQ